jgi:hypothetical protein
MPGYRLASFTKRAHWPFKQTLVAPITPLDKLSKSSAAHIANPVDERSESTVQLYCKAFLLQKLS